MKKILVLMICAVFAFSGAAFSAEETVTVVSFAGDVKITPAGSNSPVACEEGMVLGEGARVITGDGSEVTLAFDKPKRNLVKAKSNTEVVIKLIGAEKIELIDGELFTLLKNLKRGEEFQVRTPCAVCGARGTGWVMITDGVTTWMGVFQNDVWMQGIDPNGNPIGDKFWTGAGFFRVTGQFQLPGGAQKMTQEQLNAFLAEFGLSGAGSNWQGFFGTWREQQLDNLQQKKDQQKLDELRKKKEEYRGGGEITKG